MEKVSAVFIVPGVPATRTMDPRGMPPPRASSKPSTWVLSRSMEVPANEPGCAIKECRGDYQMRNRGPWDGFADPTGRFIGTRKLPLNRGRKEGLNAGRLWPSGASDRRERLPVLLALRAGGGPERAPGRLRRPGPGCQFPTGRCAEAARLPPAAPAGPRRADRPT